MGREESHSQFLRHGCAPGVSFTFGVFTGGNVAQSTLGRVMGWEFLRPERRERKEAVDRFRSKFGICGSLSEST